MLNIAGGEPLQPIWSGTLTKMRVAPGEGDAPARYALADGCHDPAARAADLPLNELLGRRLELRFTGEIRCVACGRRTRKAFGPGFCFPCFRSRPEADTCIVKPELCHHGDPAHPCRDEAFARAHCFRPHVLYAALTSAPKVGITRKVNIPTRWLDQGAVAAMPLAELPDRRAVGVLEKSLAADHSDRTHWMTMLKEEAPEHDLAAFAQRLLDDLAARGVTPLPEAERSLHRFRYPVRRYPEKVRSFNLDRDPVAGGVLEGIKGQYLMFDAGVINVRRFTGYRVELHGEAP